MSPATKASALLKLKTLYVGLGYPDQWEDDSSLTVDPKDPLGNLLRVSDRAYRNAVARLGQPVDLKHWAMPPQTVGALLVFQQNSYVMSAALAGGCPSTITRPPTPRPTVPSGRSSDTISRTTSTCWAPTTTRSTGCDTGGPPRTCSASRRSRSRWSDQFSAYQPLPGLSINGKLTLTENIADLGGLAAAFDAYRKTLGSRVTDTDYVREQDREFFIAYAQTQRRKISESAMRKQMATDNHAPEDYRAATVRNLDAWYDAFDVRPGQRLYLEPAARVRVW